MKASIYCGEISTQGENRACSQKLIDSIETVIGEFLTESGVLPEASKEAEISLTFVSPSEIAEMNDEYRDVAGPTDVLSFPMWENDEGGVEPPADWETLTLGDIIVCPEIVAKNAAENGKTTENETALVICHGFLHLIGYDHADEEEKNKMWLVQDELVKRAEALC